MPYGKSNLPCEWRKGQPYGSLPYFSAVRLVSYISIAVRSLPYVFCRHTLHSTRPYELQKAVHRAYSGCTKGFLVNSYTFTGHRTDSSEFFIGRTDFPADQDSSCRIYWPYNTLETVWTPLLCTDFTARLTEQNLRLYNSGIKKRKIMVVTEQREYKGGQNVNFTGKQGH